jgi:hypothetical protein
MSHPTWIVYDRKSGSIVRIVECAERMVMTHGQWSNQYRYVNWDVCRRLLEKNCIKHEWGRDRRCTVCGESGLMQ